jgi:excisionase family DNA binding protein
MKPNALTSSQLPQWLTLSQAAQMLGVHASTLRRWADEGEIQCMRTPGGHRRFLERDLQRFLNTNTEPADLEGAQQLAQSLVAQTRQELQSERVTDAPWHEAFSEAERASRRMSGRRLLGLAIQFTSRSTGHGKILEEARRIGRGYGRDAAERGLSLVDTTKAFLFFREALIRSARPGLYQRGQYDAEDVQIHRSLRKFLDEVLFATMEAYEQALHLSLPRQPGGSE